MAVHVAPPLLCTCPRPNTLYGAQPRKLCCFGSQSRILLYAPTVIHETKRIGSGNIPKTMVKGRDKIRAEIVSTFDLCKRKILLVSKISLLHPFFGVPRKLLPNWIGKAKVYVTRNDRLADDKSN